MEYSLFSLSFFLPHCLTFVSYFNRWCVCSFTVQDDIFRKVLSKLFWREKGGREMENWCKKVLIGPSCTQSLKYFLMFMTVIETGKLVLMFFVNFQLIVYFNIFSYGSIGRIYQWQFNMVFWKTLFRLRENLKIRKKRLNNWLKKEKYN